MNFIDFPFMWTWIRENFLVLTRSIKTIDFGQPLDLFY